MSGQPDYNKGYWRDEAQYNLAVFYAVYTKDELIYRQAQHIERLQESLRKASPPQEAVTREAA